MPLASLVLLALRRRHFLMKPSSFLLLFSMFFLVVLRRSRCAAAKNLSTRLNVGIVPPASLSSSNQGESPPLIQDFIVIMRRSSASTQEVCKRVTSRSYCLIQRLKDLFVSLVRNPNQTGGIAASLHQESKMGRFQVDKIQRLTNTAQYLLQYCNIMI